MSHGPRAVIFDLYNTLVPGGSREDRNRTSGEMAAALGVDPGAFAGLVRDSFDDRTRGRLGDLRSTVRTLAQRLGVTPSEDALSVAVQQRLAMTRSLLERTWAVPALEGIRQAGLPCGLVTDCSAETPELWPESPLAAYFAAVAFSCVTGHRKPSAAAYLATIDGLGVAPEACLYVGDGGSHELSGASALGMRAIRYAPPAATFDDVMDAEPNWRGEVVADLADLVAIVS